MSAYHTITGSNYTNRLFSRQDAFDGVRIYYYGKGDEYTKKIWLEHSGIALVPGYGAHEFFDIWIYAHDVDYRSDTGGEHQINLVTNSGDVIELGTIAGCRLDDWCANEPGNNVDKGFLLQNFSFAEFLDGCDEISLEVLNPLGGANSSTFYGIAIMPHIPGTTQEGVTTLYETNIEHIRENSLGFTEFARGQPNEDGQTLRLRIPLYH